MGQYVSSKQIERSRELASLVFNGAIDRMLGRISERQWLEIRFASCMAECDPMLSPEASRDMVAPRLQELQFTHTSLERGRAVVTYCVLPKDNPRLAPTDRSGLSIEEAYCPARVEFSDDRLSSDRRTIKPPQAPAFAELVIEWKHPGMVDMSMPLDQEIIRLKHRVESGLMAREQMLEAILEATGSLGISLEIGSGDNLEAKR